jgi:hypothetical protein
LTVAGVLLSEYAIAASLVGLVILAALALTPLREDRYRARTAFILSALATTISYGGYRWLSNLTYRTDVDPSVAAANAKHKIAAVILDLITGVWHSAIGGYGGALESVALYRDSPSTILGVSYGLVIAFVVGVTCGRRRFAASTAPGLPRWKQVSFLSLALIGGLAPVSFMGRSTTLAEFGSRFVIPALPVAAVLTVLLVVTLFRPHVAWIPAAVLGLACGNAAVLVANTAVHHHRLVTSIGAALRPYVFSDSNYTVAVVSMNGMDYELTGIATKDWPTELGKKLWIYDYGAGLAALGSRTTCNPPTDLHKNLRLLERTGPIGRLLWVETRGENLVSIEPYCKGDAKVR